MYEPFNYYIIEYYGTNFEEVVNHTSNKGYIPVQFANCDEKCHCNIYTKMYLTQTTLKKLIDIFYEWQKENPRFFWTVYKMEH